MKSIHHPKRELSSSRHDGDDPRLYEESKEATWTRKVVDRRSRSTEDIGKSTDRFVETRIGEVASSVYTVDQPDWDQR